MLLSTAEDPERAIAMIEQARNLLVEAKTFDEVKKVRDLAAAATLFVRARDAGRAAAVGAGEIVLRAERRLGEWLANGSKSKGGRPAATPDIVSGVFLRDMGIDYHQSSRWQRLAAVPEKVFDAYIDECRAVLSVPTAAGARRLAPTVTPLGARSQQRPVHEAPVQDYSSAEAPLRARGDGVLPGVANVDGRRVSERQGAERVAGRAERRGEERDVALPRPKGEDHVGRVACEAEEGRGADEVSLCKEVHSVIQRVVERWPLGTSYEPVVVALQFWVERLRAREKRKRVSA